MGFLSSMVGNMIGESVGVNPRQLRRLLGGKGLLIAGGAALVGALSAQKPGAAPAGGHERWSGGRAAAPPPPPPPAPGRETAFPPPELPPIPTGLGQEPEGLLMPPPPATGAAAGAEVDELEAAVPRHLLFAIVRTMAAAAMADGHLAPQEKAAIQEHLGESGLSAEQIARIQRDVEGEPAAPGELAALARLEGERETLYRFATLILRSDERVSPQELDWLDGFAGALSLPDERAAELHREVFEKG